MTRLARVLSLLAWLKDIVILLICLFAWVVLGGLAGWAVSVILALIYGGIFLSDYSCGSAVSDRFIATSYSALYSISPFAVPGGAAVALILGTIYIIAITVEEVRARIAKKRAVFSAKDSRGEPVH